MATFLRRTRRCAVRRSGFLDDFLFADVFPVAGTRAIDHWYFAGVLPISGSEWRSEKVSRSISATVRSK